MMQVKNYFIPISKYDHEFFFILRLLTFYVFCTFFDSIYARIVCEITN